MLHRLSIRTRLIATMAILGLIIVFIGLLGIYGMRSVNASLEDVYSDQLQSSIAIAEAKNHLSRARLAQDRGVFHPESPDLEKLLERVNSFIVKSDNAWQRYMALEQGPEEQTLADVVAQTRKAMIEQGLNAMSTALRSGDKARIDQLAMTDMQKLFSAFSDASDKLDQYQVDASREEFEASQKLYGTVLTLSIGAVLGGLVLMVVTSVVLMRAIMAPLREALGHFDAMSSGDLSRTVDTSRHDEMGTLLKGLDAMQRQLAVTVTAVREGSGSIAVASAEIADGNLDLSRRTEQQAASLEETASSLEELTATVRQNADNARQANQMVGSASTVAQQGGQLVAQVVNTMGTITESSHKIVDIIAVIDGIAFQTNILALNAAVEAARAGEQGRGFAVVASEVRNLAQRSAAAAKEIKALIDSSVANVNTGSALVDQAGCTMTQIVTSVAQVADIMTEIMSASTEQSAGIDLIHNAVVQMDQVTQQNAALVEEAAAAAGALQEQAATLEETVSVFRLQQATAPAAALRRPAPASSGRLALA
ncbi:methyl-accepting chemotaxis protein [Pseudoduganella plicata]|uniref:Methyl-accepting chemotaxis protein n=1 Tax=Pseudoduganella plicata TaxID=321984 RepID=A0A4P7BDP6_9BURK|nr:methyl-accepting chemotaxis protein [Pseudoduganella plicata]QBQ36057.1 methyl-accepting chemotaxis protein [Pseudoduganella plicata]GGY78419.1 methyl-accepting chemotaxis protein [Pseudoduganella plicata]